MSCKTKSNPKNIIVVASAPHSQVFPVADLVITHAGHGTIMRALSHSLPLVCLPMGRDQVDNAVKIEYHGCGIRLSPKARPLQIRKAVLRILEEPQFKKCALQFKEEIHSCEQDNQIYQELDNLIGHVTKQDTNPVEAEIQYSDEVRDLYLLGPTILQASMWHFSCCVILPG